MQLTTVIEAFLIASGEGLSTRKLYDLLFMKYEQVQEAQLQEGEPEIEFSFLEGISEKKVLKALEELNAYYEKTARSFQIIETAKGWKLYTRPEYASFLSMMNPSAKTQKLSQPAMETLAIIAYRQPVTKASIESVRGVSSDGMVQKLLDNDLVKIAGRSEMPGRPILYATSEFFYEHFGVKDLDELPNSAELRNMAWPKDEKPSEEREDPSRQLTLGEYHERALEESQD